MDWQKLVEISSKAAEADRHQGGQRDLGWLVDVLSLAESTMPIMWDTGEHFGEAPLVWDEHDELESRIYSQPAYESASRSQHAYPSCYRGYYSDCTFNCNENYPLANVAHVLNIARQAMGRSFEGYKGGVYQFGPGTLVWGGTTSHGSTGNSRMLMGFDVTGGIMILKTAEEEW